MFKLESFITPLILNYVDKYIKNLRPEDSQFSLWGGDAVFSNLDLRLDVLEKEVLQLPFTFVNGHIHELRIHVPWTKLISEPIVITINTIECILKLRDAKNEEKSSTSSLGKNEAKKKNKKSEEIDVPPGYVKSLVNKIINNIKFVCNNVILKYVEDDIVLSLNVKSAEFFSVNEKWEPAYVDLSLPELALRKLANLTDLTICLDKRNASGKIEIYHDPLLYRCSLSCRLYTRYNTLHSKQHSIVRLGLFCENLDFSVTDDQVPMLIKLVNLFLALYYGRINCEEPSEAFGLKPDSGTLEQSIEDDASKDGNEESWGSWAWSFVPSIVDDEDEDEEVDASTGKKFPPPVFQYAIHVKSASFMFKHTETIRDQSRFTKSSIVNILKPQSSTKVTFVPLIRLNAEGIGFLTTARLPDFVEIQFGITKLKVSSTGLCVCGMDDHLSADEDQDGVFFECGHGLKRNDAYYLKDSLFDPESPENQGKQRQFLFDWDGCIDRLLIPGNGGYAVWDKYGGFLLQSMYMLNFPSDWIEKSSEISLTESFLETSNLNERAICRFILGESRLDVNSSMMHRIQKLWHFVQQSESDPYNCAPDERDVDMRKIYSPEEVRAVEHCMPLRTYEVSILRPTVNVYVANHASNYDQKRALTAEKKKSTLRKPIKKSPDNLPILVINTRELNFQLSHVMYSHHITKAALSSLLNRQPNRNIVHNAYLHSSLQIHNMEAFLTSSSANKQICILPSSAGTVSTKIILHSKAWRDRKDSVLLENHVEVSQINFHMSKPQLYLLTNIFNSWVVKDPDPSRLSNTSLLEDVLSKIEDQYTLKFIITNIEFTYAETSSIRSVRSIIDSFHIKMKTSDEKEFYLFHGPEDVSGVHATSFFSPTKTYPQPVATLSRTLPGMASTANTSKFITALFQLPIDPQSGSTASYLALLHIQGFTSILDPVLLKWLNYQPVLTSEGISRVAMVSDVDDLASSLQETKPSSTPSSLPSGSELQIASQNTPSRPPTSSGVSQTTCKETKSAENMWSEYFLKYCLILNDVLIQVQCGSACILVPNNSLSPLMMQNNLCLSIKQVLTADDKTRQENILVISLPAVNLFSNSIQRHFQISDSPPVPPTVPVFNYLDGVINAGQFPWTVEISNLSVYTLHKKESTSQAMYVLNPLGLSSTVAVNAKSTEATQSPNQVAFCVHADMESLHLNCSVKQIQLISELGCFVAKFIPLLTRPPDLISNLSHQTLQHMVSKSPVGPIMKMNLSAKTPSLSSVPVVSLDTESLVNVEDKDSAVDESFEPPSPSKSVSLWLQWTLPKFCLNIFSSDGLDDSWLMLELEDLMAAFDIQDVYLKVKSKISAFNITNFQKKTAESEWKTGKYGGIILSSSDKIAHQVLVLDTKTGAEHIMPHLSMFEHSPSGGGEASNHGFFAATFTQALSTNVHSKLKQHVDHESSKNLIHCHSKHIQEIEVKMQPLDLIVQPLVTLSAVSVFQPLIDLITSNLPYSRLTNEDMYPHGWDFNNKNLPLVHLNTSTVRLFVFDELGYDGAHDMVMLQIDSVAITPHAENPLPRQVLQPAIYSATKRIHHVPGSAVENRQYQIDISGISLSSGCWKDFVDYENVHQSEFTSCGENPALEWNTRGLSGLKKSVDILLYPILSSFDVKVTVAPAIVFSQQNKGQESGQELLVCGISAEVNMVTEIIICLSIEQVKLIHKIVASNTAQFSSGLAVYGMKNDVKDSGIDSDVSFLRSFVSDNANEDDVSGVLKQVSFVSLRNNNFVPFDLLSTANSITLMTYFDEGSLPAWTQIARRYDNGERKRPRKHNFPKPLSRESSTVSFHTAPAEEDTEAHPVFPDDMRVNVSGSESSRSNNQARQDSISSNTWVSEEAHRRGYDGSNDSQLSDTDDDEKNPRSRVYPFLLVEIAQPHTLLNCHSTSQKCQISCFDFSVRGSPGIHSISSQRSIPGTFDFKVPWLETTTGEADIKTGVPASLFTLNAQDFINQSGKASVKIDRPLKLNFSLLKFEQLCAYIAKLSANSEAIVAKYGVVHGGKSNDVRMEINEKKYSFEVTSVDVSSRQIVACVEVVPHVENAHIAFSLDELNSNLLLDFRDDVKHLKNSTKVNGLLIVTSYCNVSRHMVGPCSQMEVSLSLNWSSVPSAQPVTSAKIKMETIPIKVMQEHVKCISAMRDKIESNPFVAEILQYFTKDDGIEKSRVKKQNSGFTRVTFEDDLRRGKFQYIKCSDGDVQFPRSYEIVFNTEASRQNPASMSWTYPQLRFLSKLEIYPVPFYNLADSTSEDSRVQCKLQYWNDLRQRFINYKKFEIVEASHFSVDLDDVGHSSIVDKVPFSTTWRVLLDVQDDDNRSAQLKVSPVSLAACLKVNSIFDPDRLPFFRVSLESDLIFCTIYNNYDISSNASKLHPYELDSSMPTSQEIGSISLDSFSTQFQQRTTCKWIKMNGDFGLKLMNYHTLMMVNFLDACNFEGTLFLKKEPNQPMVQELEIGLQPLYIHAGQTAIHSLNLCSRSWASFFSGKSCSLIPTFYTICNNTNETINFGQVNTDESVSLAPRKMHCYCWRTLKSSLKLRLCVKGSEWSSPFSPFTQAKMIRSVKNKPIEINVILTVKKVSETHVKIIFDGLLTIANRFNQHLEIQIAKANDHDPSQKKRVKPECHILGRKTTLPSFAFSLKDLKHFRVRLMGLSSPWSNEISLKSNHTLVQLPLKKPDKYIDVWLTICQEDIGGINRYLVLFTPLYILRSYLPQSLLLHISTPSVNKVCEIPVNGKGNEHDIVVETASPDLTHQLNFQIGNGNRLSNPSLPLSPSMIDQVSHSTEEVLDLEEINKNWVSRAPLKWPYYDFKDNENAIDELSDEEVKEKLLAIQNLSQYKVAPLHPNIDLQVQLSRRWKSCKSLLIDVKPSMLFINKTGLDLTLVLSEQGAPETWYIPCGTVFTPPKIKGSFRLGIQKKDDFFESDPLQFSMEDWSSKSHWPNKVKGLIPAKGHTNISIVVLNEEKGLNYVCQLTVQTRVEEEIQIVTILQSYYIYNHSERNLELTPFCFPQEDKQFQKYSTNALKNPITISSDKNDENLSKPIYLWQIGHKMADANSKISLYVRARHVDTSGNSSKWSVPVLLPAPESSNSDQKVSLVVPCDENSSNYFTRAYVLTCHTNDGVCIVIVKENQYPCILLTNYCNFALHFGQSVKEDNLGTKVKEEQDGLDRIPFILAKTSTQYVFPETCRNFPNVDPPVGSSDHKLHLCHRNHQDSCKANVWSTGISMTDENDQFLSIPGSCDVRIIKQLVGNTIHVAVIPIHRAVILAKNVRSKINASANCGASLLTKTLSVDDSNQDSSDSITTANIEEHINVAATETPVKKGHRRTPSQHIQPLSIQDKNMFFLSVLMRHVCVILVNEEVGRHSEVIRVSLDDLSCSLRPHASSDNQFSIMNSLYEKFQFVTSVGNMQIDNQLQDHGFDFPVILTPRDPEELIDPNSANKSNLLHFDFGFTKYNGSYELQSAKISTRPISVHLEDQFFYKVKDVIMKLIPNVLDQGASVRPLWLSSAETNFVPLELVLTSDVLSKPFKINELVIEPVEVMLSIHASVKIYLSIDCTPLSFKIFRKVKLATSSYALGRHLTMHYLSGALLRAGWVLASMDLLGNPAGFARSVGTGLSNFIKLPYRGMLQGPWTFLVGISHGSVSLAKHITSGTLVSVTNLASSVSRNMDRLSLDSSHASHQELLRQQKPKGLSRGLMQGLNGLGYSLLGAIAGLVDKPLQNMIDKSPVNAMSGAVSGLSQGMIGVVTKPIGGAAEFVAQTGQGILHGAGWSKVFHRRYDPYEVDVVSISSNSSVKYGWKIMSLISTAEIVYSLDSTHINQSGNYILCSLVLTNQALFIISEKDDAKHQAYALSEISCSPSTMDPTLIYIEPRKKKPSLLSQSADSTQARITEFVNKQDKSHQSSDSDHEVDTASNETRTKFCIHPKHRCTFLILFTNHQRKLLNKGFYV